jgi:hypothetical protein
MKPLELNDLISLTLNPNQAIFRVTNISSSLDEYSEPFVTAHCIDHPNPKYIGSEIDFTYASVLARFQHYGTLSNPTQEAIGNPQPEHIPTENSLTNFYTAADNTILLYENNALPRSFAFYRLVADASEAKDNLEDLVEYIDLLNEEPEENAEEINLYEDGVEHFEEQFDKFRTELANKLNR